jgi:hypothetical protein
MSARRQAGRFPWVVAVLVAIGLVLGAVSLLQVPVEPTPVAGRPPPRVELARTGDLEGERMLREEVALLDPRPLFLPTERNAGRAGALSDDGRREPGASFNDFSPQLNYNEEDVAISFPVGVTVPASAVAALRTEQGRDSMSSFGRRDAPLAALPQRLGFIEVVLAQTGRVVLQDELSPSEGAPTGDWTPVELVAAVGPGGLIGLPVLNGSSGSEGIDAWFPSYLANRYRLGERLQPGFYRIRLGP